MEVCVLASGSGGNCLYVAGGGTRLLVDAGLSLKVLAARLKQVGVDPDDIQAVLLTHDHADHCSGVGVLRRRHGLPFYANEGTAAGVELALGEKDTAWSIFETGTPFEVGGLTVEPFSVPHDAADAVGFVVTDGRCRLGIATDLGMATTLVRRKLSDCDALVLEANHDVELLQQSGRPWSLLQRIRGRHGHLSNDAAATLLAEVLGPRLKAVVLAHLSAECNAPGLAERTVRAALRRAGREDVRVEIAAADANSALLEV